MKHILFIYGAITILTFASAASIPSVQEFVRSLPVLKENIKVVACPQSLTNLLCAESTKSVADLKAALNIDGQILNIVDTKVSQGDGFDFIGKLRNVLFMGSVFPNKNGKIRNIILGDESNPVILKRIRERIDKEAGNYISHLRLYMESLSIINKTEIKLTTCESFLNSPLVVEASKEYSDLDPNKYISTPKLQKILQCKLTQTVSGSYIEIETDKGIRLFIDSASNIRSIPPGETLPDLTKLP
ncbi:hypothetical protein MF271_05125 [Deinococcus sp. KNUC1210]|uniref:hypothetical protein n=1 Tax=Deinococcus sp. KNUC1210 TaxID=2917691 RepID=UPI001EF14FEF|nr:hypothetical protein [Deinococcus sp. KNUC1210]ULH16018.1 hypothetical protein MF271_05125 [Deinococcus sp. KNUC1210]